MNSYVNVQVRVMTAQAQSQLAALGGRITTLEKNFGKANRASSLFGMSLNGMRLDSFGSRIQWIGRQLEYNFTLPILAAAAASMKLALDNETAFTRVTKVYGDAAQGAEFYGKEIEALRRNFIALSNAYGVTQKETIEIAAGWAAAGASGIALAKSVDLTMQTMILGEMKAGEATQALIAIQAQYGFSVGELTKTISVLNMVENQTGISLRGLVEGFARAAGVARSAGVDVRHLAAMLAALTPASGSAAQAGNALKTIFSRLLSPTQETVEILELMGISIGDLSWKSATVTTRLGVLAQSFEKLSTAQKGVVSSVIASRWQINKFEVLMRELLNQNGYYQKALRSTASEQEVFNQKVKELNAVLNSNPRRLQILWTMLQNAAADIIQPLIPMLLWLATAIKNLVTWFSNLNPAVQKIALIFLLLLATVGPLVRIGGALVLMAAQLGAAFKLLWAPIALVGGGLKSLLKTPIVWFLTQIGVAVRGAVASLVLLGPVLARLSAVMQGALLAGARAAGAAWRAGLSGMIVVTSGIWSVITYITGRAIFGIQGILLAGAALAGRVWRAGLLAIAAFQGAWALLMLIGWGGLWRGMVMLTAGGLFRIQVLLTAFIPRIRAIMSAMWLAATGPWGIAIGAILLLVIGFWNQLKKIWAALVDGTIAAFNTLPAGIRNAMMSVVNVVRSAVMAVYRLFSYLNPWAQHSPSLVQNVTTGVAEIKKQFSALDRIGEIFRKAGFDLHSFGAAVEKIKRIADLQSIADQRKDLAGLAAGSLPLFDKLVKVLFPLKDLLSQIGREVDAQQQVVDKWKSKLDAANAALEAQEKILKGLQDVASNYKDQLDAAQAELDRFANAPIQGMKAMEDAIFNNQMQQKALRLEMMKLEDAVGPLDQLQDRISAINGQMELLSGEQAGLRNAGAGSDILSFYDDQLAALEQQKDAINEQVRPLQDLADQIENLGRQAEMLDLEKSLAFDPLKKQIDDLVNSMQEMPFEEILAGVIANKAEVDRLTEAYNQANLAVEQQQAVVDQLLAQRDAIQASYDLESTKLQQLKDEYAQVEEKIRAIESALQDMGAAARSAASAAGGGAGGMSPGAANFLASAGGNFPEPGGLGKIGREGGIGDQSKLIDDFTKEMSDKVKNMFGSFDLFEPIKKGWNRFTGWFRNAFGAFKGEFTGGLADIKMPGWLTRLWDLLGPPLKEIGNVLKDHLKPAWEKIQPELAKFKELAEPLAKLWREQIAPALKVAGGIILGVLLLALSILANVLKNVLGPVIDWIIDVIGNAIEIFRGLAKFIVGVFTLDWKMAWDGIWDILKGTWDLIWSTIVNAGKLIWGVVKGIVEGIVNFFKWLYNVLVGHSIIPDMINAIVNWFNKFKGWAKSIWDAIVNALKAAWDWVWNQVKSKIDWAKGAIDAAVQAIKNIFSKLGDAWKSVVDTVKGLIDKFVDRFNDIKNRFKFSGLFDGIKNAFKSAINWIIGKWNNLQFSIGGGSFMGIDIPKTTIGTPDIGYLARGGMIARHAMAVIGEGRSGYPEYVIPTDPLHRRRAMALYRQLGGELNQGNKTPAYTPSQSASTVNNYNIYGNLEFPNITSGDDADRFISHLETLARGGV